MRIGTTPTHTFELPYPAETVKEYIKKYEIVYSQRGEVLVCKTDADCTMDGNIIAVELTQEETLLFNHNIPVEIQMKVMSPSGKVTTSDIVKDMPYRCLKKAVLANDDPEEPEQTDFLARLIDRSITEVTAKDLEGVEKIGTYAFSCCDKLVRVTIPANVKDIGDYAFENCRNLVEVYNCSGLPIEAESEDYGWVGMYAKNIYTPESGESKVRTSDGFALFDGDDKGYVLYYTGNAKHLNLSELFNGKMYEIYPEAFKNSSIESIIIDGGIESIGYSAFYGCNSLKKVVLGGNITSVSSVEGFADCQSLIDITLGENITSIGFWAFGQAIPNEPVTYRIKAKIPPTVYLGISIHAPEYVKEIIVPKGCKDMYMANTNWANYAEKIVEADE